MADALVTVWMMTATSIAMSVAGQLLLKTGMRRIVSAGAASAAAILLGAATNPAILLGTLCFLSGTASWLLVLSKLDLSVAYPLGGLSHVLITLTSWLILGEPVRLQRWMGVALVVIGVILVGRS
jgi:undecaprenyl phosphate-alpha-L-ara4N flippase subunit ArnE